MTAGVSYKMNMYYGWSGVALYWKHEGMEESIPDSAFAPELLIYTGLLKTGFLNITSESVIIDGDLVADQISINNSTLIIKGSLMLNTAMYLNSSVYLNISYCMNGTGTIFVDPTQNPTMITEQYFIHFNCLGNPTLPVIFTNATITSCLQWEYQYSEQNLIIFVKDHCETQVKVESITTPIIIACVILMVIIVFIYVMVRRYKYAKAMSKIEENSRATE